MNKHRFVFPKTFLLTALFAASTCHLVAGSLYIGTVNNGAAWTVTLEGPSGDVTGTAFQSPDNSNISFSSDDKEDGTFVAGADAAAFDGAWYADLDFFLPANATNVTLSFNNLTVDDRVVLELNGVIIGDAGFGGTTDSKGRMAFNLDAPLT
jgi:hypothetical protein